jgi:hypothetical protein
VGSWGKLIFIIPYRAYSEVNADIYLKKTKLDDGNYLFKFYKITTPVYYVQTIDFIPHEIHIRVGDLTIKKGFSYGRKKLNDICLQNKLYCKTVPLSKRKSLPFLFKEFNENIFSFIMNKNGRIFEKSITNRISLFYAWPANSEFGIPSFNMLAASLCFLNIPYDNSSVGEGKYRILNINLNRCLNKVLYQAIPTVRKFVKLRQKRLFHLHFSKEKKGEVVIYTGVATPNVKVWGKFHIKKVIREIRFEKGETVFNRFYIEVYDKKGRGGTGEVILKRVN